MTRHALGRPLAFIGGLVFIASLATGVVAYTTWFGDAVATGATGVTARAILVDAALFTTFALHHSLFARTGAKDWIGSIVSPQYERSVYVWIASVLFMALCATWQAVPGVVWRVPAPWAALLLTLQLSGMVVAIAGSRQLDMLDLAGVRQAWGLPGRSPVGLVRGGLYRLVRHPIYLGWVLMVWPTATMTGTRLTFAAISTAYLMVAVPFEERALRRSFGRDYDAYARAVRWRMLPFVY